MLILCFDFISCYLFEVSHKVIIGYSLRYSDGDIELGQVFHLSA